MPIFILDGHSPEFEHRTSNWIAPDATIVGKVFLGENANIWFVVVLRGDNE